MSRAEEDVAVSGHCYCGGVTFEVRIPAGESPIFTAYCHCDSCRRAHAAPLYHVVCVDETMFTITRGEELLAGYTRPDGYIRRTFCTVCGSKVLNRFEGWKPDGKVPLAFFPNLLDEAVQHDLPEPLRPERNNRPEECVLDAAMLSALIGHT
jgi:hypothetical protein